MKYLDKIFKSGMKSILSPSHPDFIGTSSWLGYGIFLKKKLQTNQGSIVLSFARENVNLLVQSFTQDKINLIVQSFTQNKTNSLVQSFTTGTKITITPTKGIYALTIG